MNDRMRHILVPIGNPKRVPAAQLRKAATIARASGATVELFHAVLAPSGMPCDRVPEDHVALKRLFIGSTAERVLDDLTCDVLIVKPLSVSTQSGRQKATQRLRAA